MMAMPCSRALRLCSQKRIKFDVMGNTCELNHNVAHEYTYIRQSESQVSENVHSLSENLRNYH